LLRLWLVLSLCWIVVVGLFAWPYAWRDTAWSCGEIGELTRSFQPTGKTSFVCLEDSLFRHSDPVTLKVGGQSVKVDRQFLQQLSPEEQNRTVAEIAKILSLEDNPTTATIKEYAPYALLPPLVTLVLGLLGVWVASGFARRSA
jgi:hypothetical protein